MIRVSMADDQPEQRFVCSDRESGLGQEIGRRPLLGVQREPRVEDDPLALGLDLDHAAADLVGASADAGSHSKRSSSSVASVIETVAARVVDRPEL